MCGCDTSRRMSTSALPLRISTCLNMIISLFDRCVVAHTDHSAFPWVNLPRSVYSEKGFRFLMATRASSCFCPAAVLIGDGIFGGANRWSDERALAGNDGER